MDDSLSMNNKKMEVALHKNSDKDIITDLPRI